MSAVWLAEHVDDGQLNGRVGRDGEDLVAEWVGVATLRVRRDGSNVRFVAAPDATDEDVEKIRRGSARLLLRHLEAKLGFHGSAVSVDGHAVALVGSGGAGKSTLAAALCSRASGELIADDAVALDSTTQGHVLVALESQSWLDAASRRALRFDEAAHDDVKTAVTMRTAPGTSPLVAIVELSFRDLPEPRLIRLDGVAPVASLLPHVVRFVVDEPKLQRQELESLAALVEVVPIYRLERPRSLDMLDSTVAIVVDLARRGDAIR